MIRANFTAYSSYVTDSLYQWDKNRTLVIEGLNLEVVPEIHFTNASMDKAIVRQSTLEDGSVIVGIPNSLLQQAYTIRAYIGIYEDDTFKTIEVIDIPVIAKEKPSDYTISDTDEEIYSFNKLENDIANAKKEMSDKCDSNLVEMSAKVDENSIILSARIDNIIANNGNTDGNTELIDIRTGVDGTIYNSAGEAVRRQVGDVRKDINLIETVLNKEILVNGGNLFDKTSSNIINNAYVKPNSESDSQREQSGYFITPYIQVEQGKTYASVVNTYFFTETNALKVAVYNRNKEYVGFLTAIGTDTTDTKSYKMAFTVNQASFTPVYTSSATIDDVVYIRLSYMTLYIDSYMLVEGNNYPSEYREYGDSVYSITIDSTKIKNKLTGKIISFIGDSICAGHYVDPEKTQKMGGYGKIIAERNGMIYENLGVHGATITSNTGKHCISTSIENMRADADYIILEGGVNDASLNVALGNITSDYTSDFDITTFAGAFEHMLKTAILRYPGKKIGYIFTHKISPRYLVTDIYGAEETHYTIAKKCCEKWGVSYVDLNAISPLSRYIEPLKNAYTNNQDGWHPNEEGYRKYYCDPIEQWLLNL